MFKDKDIQKVLSITNDLIQIISSKHIASARAKLEQYSGSLKGENKEIFDMIISYAIQGKIKPPITRYNLISPDQNHLDSLDKLVVLFNKEMFNKLPHQLQNTIYLCSNHIVYRWSTTKLRKLLKNYYPVITDNVFNGCKRCYCSTEDIICQECKDKLERAVEFQSESFIVTGTTIEAFEYKFKDWSVQVNNFGEYKFNRLKYSTIIYQPNLPITDYQNLLVLVG